MNRRPAPPLPLGFLALAAGTLLLATLNLGWLEPADGRQVAIVSFRQNIPWLKRLDAREQQACFQAWALDSAWQAERLRSSLCFLWTASL